jgi:Fanconi anemia group M protein
LYEEYVVELRKRNVLFGVANKITLIELQRKIMFSLARGNKNFSYFHAASACAQAIKIQHALELLETQTLDSFNKYLKELFNQASKNQSKGVVKLTAKPEFNYVFTKSAEMLAKKQEHPKLLRLIEVIKEENQNKDSKTIIFTQFRNSASIISKKLNEIPKIKAKVFVGQTKKITEKKEFTGLSQKEQKKIIQEFSEGEINTLVATSIGEEGLDIPEVNTVIFYEPIPSAIRNIQRRGRTARLIPGKIIMLMTKNTRDMTFYYSSKAKEKRMHSAIKTIKEELANENNSDSNNKDKIKSEEQGRLF